jgi:hypothetical protein
VRTSACAIQALFWSDKFYSFLKIISKVIANDIMILDNQALYEATAIFRALSSLLG